MHINDLEAAIRELDARVIRTSLELVSDISPSQLSDPTPCTDWNLAQLLEHMSAQHRGFAAAARGQGADPANWHQPSAYDDPVRDYREAAENALAAFAEVDLTAQLDIAEFGPDARFPAAKAMTFHFFDYLVHGWDVAQATGQPFTPEPDLVEAGWAIGEIIPTDEQSRPAGGPFGPVVPVPAEASSFAKLLAHVGRTPNGS